LSVEHTPQVTPGDSEVRPGFDCFQIAGLLRYIRVGKRHLQGAREGTTKEIEVKMLCKIEDVRKCGEKYTTDSER
jgi:hypothetical protein